MRKLFTGICAAALTVAFGAAAPAISAPIAGPQSFSGTTTTQERHVIPVQQYRGGQQHTRGGQWRDRRIQRRGGTPYFRGYRGRTAYRPGYRRHGGYWFPPAAFIAGAIIGGAMASSPPARAGTYSQRHIDWCYNRYRSYRDWDNTFQPYQGPRRPCISPYG